MPRPSEKRNEIEMLKRKWERNKINVRYEATDASSAQRPELRALGTLEHVCRQ